MVVKKKKKVSRVVSHMFPLSDHLQTRLNALMVNVDVFFGLFCILT